jgi:hypothetical protein
MKRYTAVFTCQLAAVKPLPLIKVKNMAANVAAIGSFFTSWRNPVRAKKITSPPPSEPARVLA